MNMKSKLDDTMFFIASALVGCAAAIAIAATASVGESAPTPRGKAAAEQAVQVVRLDPVVVTVSQATFDTVRNEEIALARANATRKVAHG